MDEERGKQSKICTFLAVILPLSVALAHHEQGLVIGWSSVLPKIQSDNSTSLNVGDEDVQWLASITGIVGMVCTLAVGPVIEIMGPRRLLLWIQIPTALFWIMSVFTPYISLLYLSRIGLTAILSIVGSLGPILISEISDPKIRGFTLAMIENVMAFSLLIMYIMVDKLHWVTATFLGAVPAVALFITYSFLPESPYWLARHGQLERAERSLYKLRFSDKVAAEEMSHLSDSITEMSQNGAKYQIVQLKHRQNFLPVLLLTGLFILRELGGGYVAFTYTVYIFAESVEEHDPFTCTVIVGVIRLIFTLISSLLSDRVGRRPLLIITSLGCALSAAVFGVFTLLQLSITPWINLISLLLYVGFYGLGVGPIPWGLAGELLPTPVRVVGGCICLFGYSLIVSFTGYFFPVVIDIFGFGYTFLSFAVFLFIMFVIICFLFPEVNGKSLTDLQEAFQSSKKKRILSGNGRMSQDLEIESSQQL